MRKLFYIAFVALACVAFVSCKASGPGETVKAGVETMFKGGDFAQYVEPTTTDEQKKTLNENAEMAAGLLALAKTSLKEVKVLNVDENGDEATVKVSITTAIGDKEESSTEEIRVKKVDGKWYLLASDYLN